MPSAVVAAETRQCGPSPSRGVFNEARDATFADVRSAATAFERLPEQPEDSIAALQRDR
jgi:hypothetical protein